MKVMDGNTACAIMAYNLSEISYIYPITPSSQMASQMDLLKVKKERNVFNDTVDVIEMQSEAGAAGALHGALSAGMLASTFTSSQGLLLMIPNMYKIAGEMLPGVIHVAARSLATHALSIFGDHQDIYATRQTGFSLLASTNVKDAYNLALVAHLSAIDSSIPFLHFFDGFRTSHEYNQVSLIEIDDIKEMINHEKIVSFRNKAINSYKPVTKGTAQNEDIYFQSTEARNQDYNKLPDIVNKNMQKLNKKIKTNYKPFNYYGSKNAKFVIVAMGSVCDTIKKVVEDLNKKQNKFGLIEVHLYRPFSKKYLEMVLPKSVSKIAVLDRTKEFGSSGEPLYLDVLSSLNNYKIEIVGGRYGLSSKNTTPSDIYDVFMMLKTSPQNNFTIGITDDVTRLSLKKYDYEFQEPYREFKIFGFGSDGLVTASKDILKVLSNNNYVQGYFEYDSKKSGGVTISHLRLHDKPINAPYYITSPELIVVSKDEYFHKFSIIDGIKKDGIILINTIKNAQEINDFLPTEVKKVLIEKNIKLIGINAEKIAAKNNIKGKISLILETCILKLLNISNCEEILIKNVNEIFKTKGTNIVNGNINSIKSSVEEMFEIKLDNLTGSTLPKNTNIFDIINSRKGDLLPVSKLYPYRDGIFPGETTKYEKRKLSNEVPKWNKKTCIECGMCSAICPHAVVRPFLLDNNHKYKEEAKDSFNKDMKYLISVSEADCTGCGLCIKICPTNSLSFGSYDNQKQEIANDLFNNHKNIDQPTNNIRGTQLKKPLFEFSGACAGCGETSYIKLLTQIVGKKLVIANATGCSSIYGASVPNMPYNVAWANSLFEDNAEFGFGLLQSYEKMQNRILNILKNNSNKESQELYNLLISKEENIMQIKENKDKFKKYISEDLIDYVTPKSVWTIGGDGWAYDIGFGGIDHVLSSNANVKILVLDTEVYSNTGGQSSKATKIGAVAEFANLGKKTIKKDLFKIAMAYPNVYVASINFAADMMHTIKVIKEAELHQGPAIIIAYSPCVEHGIVGGLTNSIESQKLSVASGYNILMRYKDQQLFIDSPEPNFDLYQKFLENEIRYSALKIKDKNLAEQLSNKNTEEAINRFKYYKNLANK